jgi:hypothetical protein
VSDSISVVHVDLDGGLRPVALGRASGHALLVVRSDGGVLGEVVVPARGVLSVEAQQEAIGAAMGDQLWGERWRSAFPDRVRSGLCQRR